MKTHYSEGTDDASGAKDTASEHWRDHQLPRSKLTGEFALLAVLLLVLAVIVHPWRTEQTQREMETTAAKLPSSTASTSHFSRFDRRADDADDDH